MSVRIAFLWLLFAGYFIAHVRPPHALLAQGGAAANPVGTWRVESPGAAAWTAVLRTDGPRLIGVVSSCSSQPGPIEIAEGRLEGDRVTFQCTSPNGARTLTFAGTVRGDDLALQWERSGSGGAPDEALFGVGAPRAFVAKRIADRTTPAGRALADAADRIRRMPRVTFERIVGANQTPENWLTYSNDVWGRRHSALTQITPANVGGLQLAWLAQSPVSTGSRATPLVVDGVMYTTRNTNDVVALDAETGRVLWVYPYAPAEGARATGGGGRPNRGLAILGGTLFLGTLDAHLIAIHAHTGKTLWNVVVDDFRDPTCQGSFACYSITMAPLVVKDKVIVGTGGGDAEQPGRGIRGSIAAFDATTGKEIWRFRTIPGPGEPGFDTWAGDSWRTGGAGVWNTGSYDSELNLTYWGTGNPSPPGVLPPNAATRAGDNLYSASVVALDADTGRLRWHYQFTPHDDQDWDAAQVPVLADIDWHGRPRRVMLFANKNGLAYVLDRATGEFLMGKPFVEVNWMTGFDSRGRPIRVPDKISGPQGTPVMPAGATNWEPASFSPATGLFYVAARHGGVREAGFTVRGRSEGAIAALDPRTGEPRWEFRRNDALFSTGVLTTASHLLFAGTTGNFYSDPADARRADGYFYALDARTGQELWKFGLTGSVGSPVITYAVRGRQFVAVTAAETLFAFSLR
jgi:alcohol dehydrogenase (cytochrome c)